MQKYKPSQFQTKKVEKEEDETLKKTDEAILNEIKSYN